MNEVKKHIPQYYEKARKLSDIFYTNQEKLRRIYYSLPVSCFQAALNDSNILVNENHEFAGLIDFNLCGKEPVLNYTIRECLWEIYDNLLYDAEQNWRGLYWYSEELDKLRIKLFLENVELISEYYNYSTMEHEAFPIIFRYINSIWWQHTKEIEKIKDDSKKIDSLFSFLEYQMTRDDIRLP